MKTINLITLSLLLLVFTACDRQFEISADADEYLHVDVGGAQLPLWVRGNTASNKILLFIQGGPGGSTIDFAQIDYPGWEESLEKDMAIAYYDQRGTGNMQGNFDLESISLQQYAEDIRQLLVVLHDKYPDAELYLLGHSFGGYLAMDYLQRFPDDELLTAVINMHGPATTDHDTERWEYRRAYLENVAIEMLNTGKDTSQWNEVIAWTKAHPVIETAEEKTQWNRYIALVEVVADRPITFSDALEVVLFSPYSYFSAYNYGKLDKVEQRLFDDEKSNRLITKLSAIQKPILYLTGRFDDIAPPEEMRAVLEKTGSLSKELHIIPEAGHESFLDQPDTFNQIIRDYVLP